MITEVLLVTDHLAGPWRCCRPALLGKSHPSDPCPSRPMGMLLWWLWFWTMCRLLLGKPRLKALLCAAIYAEAVQREEAA